jgi:hypothetical protein
VVALLAAAQLGGLRRTSPCRTRLVVGGIMADELIPVFMSIGRLYLSEHEILVERLTTAMNSRGLHPHALTPDRFQDQKPLMAVQSMMQRCRGALVVTFPRFRFAAGYEWPDSGRQAATGGRDLPTVWNQIEAAMAFELGLPTLVLLEERLHPEGLLNPKHSEYGAVPYSLARCQETLPAEIGVALDDFARRIKYPPAASRCAT